MSEKDYFKFTPSVWLVPTFFVLVLWIVFYFDIRYNLNLNNHGIFPRTISGLQGIIFSPFLHGDLGHISNNSIPLFILTTALLFFYRDVSLKVLFFGILFSGGITWLIGRPNIHIGASGLIYVLVSFIFFKGFLTKYYRLMALSFAVAMLYGGMIWYVLPDVDNAISWEGHLGGFLSGIAFAYYFKTPDYKKDLYYDWEKPDFNPEDDMFMKHFDENGNFVNTPEPEDELQLPEIKYIYEFKEKNDIEKID